MQFLVRILSYHTIFRLGQYSSDETLNILIFRWYCPMTCWISCKDDTSNIFQMDSIANFGGLHMKFMKVVRKFFSTIRIRIGNSCYSIQFILRDWRTKFYSVATDLLDFWQTNMACKWKHNKRRLFLIISINCWKFENGQIINCFRDFIPKWLTACRRHDLTEGLKDLQCKTLIFAGESSPFHAESVYMSSKMNHKICALVEVGCPFISWVNIYNLYSAASLKI